MRRAWQAGAAGLGALRSLSHLNGPGLGRKEGVKIHSNLQHTAPELAKPGPSPSPCTGPGAGRRGGDPEPQGWRPLRSPASASSVTAGRWAPGPASPCGHMPLSAGWIRPSPGKTCLAHGPESGCLRGPPSSAQPRSKACCLGYPLGPSFYSPPSHPRGWLVPAEPRAWGAHGGWLPFSRRSQWHLRVAVPARAVLGHTSARAWPVQSLPLEPHRAHLSAQPTQAPQELPEAGPAGSRGAGRGPAVPLPGYVHVPAR